MPYIKLETNCVLESAAEKALLKSLSRKGAELLAKPEDYVMVQIRSGQQLSLGGSSEAAGFMECKSIALPQDKLKSLSLGLSQLLKQEVGIDPSRLYIEFRSAEGPWWGWNGSTF